MNKLDVQCFLDSDVTPEFLSALADLKATRLIYVENYFIVLFQKRSKFVPMVDP